MVPGWMLQARCDGKDTNIFFIERGDNKYDKALAICAKCPVRIECLNYAIRRKERFGVWGGMTPPQRRFLLRAPA